MYQRDIKYIYVPFNVCISMYVPFNYSKKYFILQIYKTTQNLIIHLNKIKIKIFLPSFIFLL